MHTAEIVGAWHERQHVSKPKQVFGTDAPENRLRVLALGHLEGDARGKVRLDHARDHIHARPLGGQDDVQPRRARLLCQARDRSLHILGRNHHQIGELIDDQHDRWQLLRLPQIGIGRLTIDRVEQHLFAIRTTGAHLTRPLGRKRLDRHISGKHALDAGVVGRDVARTHVSEQLVAAFHLVDSPPKSQRRLLHVGHDRQQHVWNAVKHRQLHHLWIDHQ